MTFKELYNKAPYTLKGIINQTREFEQNPIYHKEGNVYTHTEIVTNRLVVYNDINLSLAGLFHDLGKIDTTVYDNNKSTWVAHNHENYSVKYVDEYSDWIKQMGGNSELIKDIVLNHMRIKFIDDMKYSKKAKLVSNPNFEYFRKFQSADYGGFEENCKPLIDVKLIQSKIKKQRINIIQRIFDKFYIRGRFILPKNNFYILKTKKPIFQPVSKGIMKSNRKQIVL